MEKGLLDAQVERANSLNVFWRTVQGFHTAAGHPDGRVTQLLTGDEKARRLAWMQEELDEFRDAKTLVDQADAMGDLLWFVLGTMVCMGIEPSVIMRPITRANMSKVGDDLTVKYRPEDGKVLKPEGWQPPEPEMADMIKKRYGVDPYQTEGGGGDV